MKNNIIMVKNIPITITTEDMQNYICITDIVNGKEGNFMSADIIKNWLRNRISLEFLAMVEKNYNPNFKVVEFNYFKNEAGLHTFTLSAFEYLLSNFEKMIISVKLILKLLLGECNEKIL